MKTPTHNPAAAAMLLAGLAGLPGSGHALAADVALAGTSWTLVRVDNVLTDGSHVALYGAAPKGRLLFDASGHYSLQIFAAARAPFAAREKTQGSADEYRAAALAINTHVGSYTLDLAKRRLTFRIEHASFANWDGSVQLRGVRLDDDRLVYTVPTPTSGAGGGATGEVEWRRQP